MTACGSGLLEEVAELDRLEREALAGDDWVELELVLERQKAMWKRLAPLAQEGVEEATRTAALEGLRRLYEARARNHRLIEQKTAALKQKLMEARLASAAGRAYAQIDRMAA